MCNKSADYSSCAEFVPVTYREPDALHIGETKSVFNVYDVVMEDIQIPAPKAEEDAIVEFLSENIPPVTLIHMDIYEGQGAPFYSLLRSVIEACNSKVPYSYLKA